jgi:hypothetical protein
LVCDRWEGDGLQSQMQDVSLRYGSRGGVVRVAGLGGLQDA